MPSAHGEHGAQEHPLAVSQLRLLSAQKPEPACAGERFQTDRHLAEASLPTQRTRWGGLGDPDGPVSITYCRAASVGPRRPSVWEPVRRECLPCDVPHRVVSAEVFPVPSRDQWSGLCSVHTPAITSPPRGPLPDESPPPLCPLRDRTPEPCAPTAPLLLCVQLRPWEAVEAGALPGHRPGASGRWRPAAGTQSPRGSFSVQREDLGLGRSPELSREKPVRHPNPWPRFSTSQPLAQL